MAANRKLEEMIHYIVDALDGSQLTRTKLVKLLYLADQMSFDEREEKISNVAYMKYYYGPFSQEIIDKSKEMDKKGLIRENRGRGSKGKFYLYEPGPNAEPASLDNEERELLNEIIQEYGNKDTKELVDEVYDEYDIDDYDKYDIIL